MMDGSSELFFETWPDSGLMSGGQCYRQPLLEPRTIDGACGLWHTPKRADCEGSGRADNSGRQRDLRQDVVDFLWGTRTARDHHDSGTTANVPENGLLGRQAKSASGQTERRGSLNPEFHSWLMGFPSGWTALEPVEMPRFQQWLEQHGNC